MSGQSSSTLLLRADLVQRRIRMGTDYVWVLKDPMARAYFYVTDREFAILRLLNGRRSLRELVAECTKRFAPSYVSSEAIVGFLAEAKNNGLIRSVGQPSDWTDITEVGMEDRSTHRSRRSIWSNPLAIRFPGMNPDRVLTPIAVNCSRLIRPATAIVWGAVITLALIVTVTRFELFCEHVSIAASRIGGGWWFVIACLIACTKVVHELAHAIVCKSLGSECREIGIMLLVGVPCLYCDVSDAWMLRDRWQRILISSAGMLAELFLAAIAVLLWSISEPGMARDICVTVAIVCSISTVLFNGNPLLRYDGYFILSDWMRVPNLGAKSATLIRRRLRRIVWALPTDPRQSVSEQAVSTRVLIGYGILSGIYRVAVMVAIAMLGYRWLASIGLGTVGGLLALLLLTSLLFKVARPIFQRPDRSIRRAATGRSRRWMIAVLSAAALLVIALVPLPRTMVAPMVVRPADAIPVYVRTPGIVVDGVLESGRVSKGDSLAVLQNPSQQLELVKQVSRENELQQRLATLRRQQVSDRSAKNQIPAVVEKLAAAKERRSILERECDELTIKAAKDGDFFFPATQMSSPHRGRSNRGVYLERGDLLGTIGASSAREAVLLVDEKHIDFVAAKQDARVLLASHPAGRIHGDVISVAASPTTEVPQELIAAGLVQPNFSTAGQLQDTYYRVRIAIDAESPLLPIRSTGQAQIRVPAESLLTRIVRLARNSFSLSSR